MILLSTKQAAKFISETTGKPMSVRQIQHEILIGRLEAQKVGHSYVVEQSALEHYARRRPGPKTTQHEEQTN